MASAAPTTALARIGSDDDGDIARAGLYGAADLTGLSAARLARWFRPEGGGWRVGKMLRELCVFSLHDLTGHPPLVRGWRP